MGRGQEFRCRLAHHLGKFLYEIDEMPLGEYRTWQSHHDEHFLLLPGECAALVASKVINWSGHAAEGVESWELVPIFNPAKRKLMEDGKRERKLALAKRTSRERAMKAYHETQIRIAAKEARERQARERAVARGETDGGQKC